MTAFWKGRRRYYNEPMGVLPSPMAACRIILQLSCTRPWRAWSGGRWAHHGLARYCIAGPRPSAEPCAPPSGGQGAIRSSKWLISPPLRVSAEPCSVLSRAAFHRLAAASRKLDMLAIAKGAVCFLVPRNTLKKAEKLPAENYGTISACSSSVTWLATFWRRSASRGVI